MILVTMGDEAGLDPVGIFAEVGEVGQDQVNAGHLHVGKHQPAVEDDDPLGDLDAGAVAADLAEAAQEDDTDCLLSPGDGKRPPWLRPRALAEPDRAAAGTGRRGGPGSSTWLSPGSGWGPRRSTGTGAAAPSGR